MVFVRTSEKVAVKLYRAKSYFDNYLTLLSLSRRILMSDIASSAELYSLVKKPKSSIEEERIAKLHEHQRRERKEKLYSYSPEKSLSR